MSVKASEAAGSAQALRTGWTSTDRKHLILWLILSFILPTLFLLILHRETLQNPAVWTAQGEILTKSITAGGVAFATWIVSRLQKRPMNDYGVPPRQILGSRFWEGAVWGFATLSAVLLTLHASGRFQIQSAALRGTAIFKSALAWGIAFYLVAVSEEFAFRGYALFLASKRVGFARAAAALSVGFAVAHLANPGETVFGILQVLLIGLLFCFMIRRTGNLWFAVGFHASWDWAQTFFYGTPDSGLIGQGHLFNSSLQGPAWISGGSAGPEGSLIASLVLLLCCTLIHLRFPKVLYPDRPV